MFVDASLGSESMCVNTACVWARMNRRSVHEAVAEPPHGDQMDGVVGIHLDLLAEPFDVDVERLRVAEVVGPPHLTDQIVACQEAPSAEQERLQELELLGGE